MSAEEKHLRQVRAIRATKMKWTLFWVAVALVVGGLIFVSQKPGDPNNPLIASAGVHYHAHLSVEVNGKDEVVPAGIGLVPGQEHPHQMHTHEADQIVHVEIPGHVHKSDMLLANFFRVWGKSLSTSTLMGIEATSTQKVSMTVNGKDEPLLGDYPMKDEDDIKLILR